MSVFLYYLFVYVCLCVLVCLLYVGDDVVEKSYLGAVSSMSVNGDYAAAVFEGKILLHLVRRDPVLSIHSCSYILAYTGSLCD